MPKNINLYVPAEFTFMNYFLPGIKNKTLEHYEVDAKRYGVQRVGNNHLVVFLDFRLKKASPQFIKALEGRADDFFLKNPADIDLFGQVFKSQKEVALFSITYSSRMSVIAWKLLIDIADNDKILVEDDKGHFMKGPDCVQELKALLVQV